MPYGRNSLESMDSKLNELGVLADAIITIARTESSKGEFGVYIVGDGGVKPYRVRVRSPTLRNLSVLPELAKDVMIADMIAISGTLDLVFGEIDR